jgi:hypothetical protein
MDDVDKVPRAFIDGEGWRRVPGERHHHQQATYICQLSPAVDPSSPPYQHRIYGHRTRL